MPRASCHLQVAPVTLPEDEEHQLGTVQMEATSLPAFEPRLTRLTSFEPAPAGAAESGVAGKTRSDATAIGLAASILTFIEFSAKILKGSAEIYKSASGESRENTHVKNVIDHLDKVTDDISAKQVGVRDEALSALCLQCDGLSRDLRKLLKKAQAKLANDKWASLVAAWRGYRRKEDVARLEKQLDGCSQQINLRLSIVLHGQQSSVKNQLDDIQKQGLAMSNTAGERMQEIRDSLRGLLGQAPSSQGSPSTDKLKQLVKALEQLIDVLPRVSRVNEILQRLHFEAIFQREDQIVDPSAKTFQWMVDWKPDGAENESDDSSGKADINGQQVEYIKLDSPRFDEPDRWDVRRRDEDERQLRRQTSNRFRRFLQESGETYFVCGKAGCGKSTFMKYLAANAAVQEELKSWASEAGKELVTVAVFFWRSGTSLQRSRDGFFRSLLFNTLRQCPELGQQLFPPERREADDYGWLDSNGKPAPFRPAALEWAFERLAQILEHSKYRICYYIDGLDEYEEDNVHHRWLADQLRSWCQQQNIKVICAARPHTVFRDAFRESGPSIMLQDLTKADIRRFSNNKIQMTLVVPEFERARRICSILVEVIVHKADGVFLWAVLVVRSILNACLAHDYSEASLKLRLEKMPPDLESLIQRMLDHADEFTRKRSQTLLLTALEAHRMSLISHRVLGWTMYTFLEDMEWFMSDKETSNAQAASLRPAMLSNSELEERHARLLQKLHHLTNGLLEMTEARDRKQGHPPGLELMPYIYDKVTFLHRSVLDYLVKSREANPELQARSQELRKQLWFGKLFLAMTKFVTPVQLLDVACDMKLSNWEFLEYLGQQYALHDGVRGGPDDMIMLTLCEFRSTLLQMKEEKAALIKDRENNGEKFAPLLYTYNLELPFRPNHKHQMQGGHSSRASDEHLRIPYGYPKFELEDIRGQESIETFKRRFFLWMICSGLWIPRGSSPCWASLEADMLAHECDRNQCLAAALFGDLDDLPRVDDRENASFLLQQGASASAALEVKPREVRHRFDVNPTKGVELTVEAIEIWHAAVLEFAASCTRKKGEDRRAKTAVQNLELLVRMGADRNIFLLAQPDADSTPVGEDPKLYRVELADLIQASNRVKDDVVKLLSTTKGQASRQSWWQQAKSLASLGGWSSNDRGLQDTVAIERSKYEVLPSSTLEHMAWQPRGLVSRRGTLAQRFIIRVT